MLHSCPPGLTPKPKMEMSTEIGIQEVWASFKAGLKPAHSKRWREILKFPANAERLDCARFIAAYSPSGLAGDKIQDRSPD